MRRTLLALSAVAALTLAGEAAHAQERLRDGLIGAGAGALVGGPVGAIAGGAIGYGAGPSIYHHGRRAYYRRRPYHRPHY